MNLGSQERKWSLNLLEHIKCKQTILQNIPIFSQLELAHSILCDDSVLAQQNTLEN